jgi:hypothetical protein
MKSTPPNIGFVTANSGGDKLCTFAASISASQAGAAALLGASPPPSDFSTVVMGKRFTISSAKRIAALCCNRPPDQGS